MASPAGRRVQQYPRENAAESASSGLQVVEDDEHPQQEVWLAGSKASRGGWLRVSDGTERVFYHRIDSGNITLERPWCFGDDNPTWADGTELFMYKGYCSRCKEFVPRTEAGPVALSADRGQVALSFLLCRPCLNWLIESALLERDGKPAVELAPPIPTKKPVLGRGGGGKKGNETTGGGIAASRKQLVKVYKNADLRGAGDLLAHSRLARGFAKGMYCRLREQTLRPGRFDEQRAECVKAKAAAVVAGEGRRRAARATQMKLRCISQHGTQGAGDYLCWFSQEGRVDYFGETSGGRANGWGLIEYQDGSWCLSVFSHGQQHTPEKGPLSTIQYANGIRYHGEMNKGKPHGKGTKTWPDESIYTGEFIAGKEHGEGTKIFADGSEHIGIFRVGIRDGPGVFIDARGQKTTGSFRDDVFSKVEEDGIVASTKTDITIESGQFDPKTLLDLAIANLAVVTDRQPALNKASHLMAKMPLHLHPLVASAFATQARGLSPRFRECLLSFAWRAVSEVRLCNARLLPTDTVKLSYFLEAIPNLKKLSVIACKLSGECILPIVDAIATLRRLEEADLSWNPIRREGARAVVAALETSPSLQRLCLAGCQLGGDGGQVVISAVGSGLEKFRLLDLDLANNSLGAGCGEALAAALGRNETLTRLSLRANGLGPAGGVCLATGLARNCGALKELVVADNQLGPDVSTVVAASMRGGTRECLRGFGFRASRVVSRHVLLDATPSSYERVSKGRGRGRAGLPSNHLKRGGGQSGAPQQSGRGNSRDTACPGGEVEFVTPQHQHHQQQRLQRPSATPLLPASGGSGLGRATGPKSREEGEGDGGGAVVVDTSAFEEEIGRPQTAGTASG